MKIESQCLPSTDELNNAAPCQQQCPPKLDLSGTMKSKDCFVVPCLPRNRRHRGKGSAASHTKTSDRFPCVNERSVAASAPGKVILFGEHAVVYGEPAVAASLSDLCVSVLVTPSEAERLRVSLDDLDVYVEIDASHLLSLQPQVATPPTKECSSLIERLLLSMNSDASDKPLMVAALTPLLYLVLVMLPSAMIEAGVDVLVRSRSLPVGAGLGSSAAFSSAVAAALRHLTTTSRNLGVPSDSEVKEIEKFSFFSEQILHGTPSGIDNAVSAHGGVILFQRATAEMPAQLTHLPTTLPLPPMLLVHTNIPRSTKQLVAHVREQTIRHPSSVRTVLRAMGQIATEFVGELSGADSCSCQSRVLFFERLRLNQHLLCSVGVSHPFIDSMCQIVSDAGGTDAAAKLTGAGGGGCVIVAFEEAKSEAIQRALRVRFPTLTFLPTHVGGPGVRWISPEQFFATEGATSRGTEEKEGTRLTAKWFAVAVAATVSVGVAAIGIRSLRGQTR
jgi:mevalonate kinase